MPLKIPTPIEFTQKYGYRPFSKRWDDWLSAARITILSAQPVAGSLITTDEHYAQGTVINVNDTGASSRLRRGQGNQPPNGGTIPGGGGGPGPGQGACENGDGSCSITSEGDCDGIWHGSGSHCISACCFPGGFCIADLTTSACLAAGGTDSGYGTGCEPNTCASCSDGYYLCRCPESPLGYIPTPRCCPDSFPICATGFVGEYVCCCCVEFPFPFCECG